MDIKLNCLYFGGGNKPLERFQIFQDSTQIFHDYKIFQLNRNIYG